MICLFTLLIVSFAVKKLLSIIRSHLFASVFISITLGGGQRRQWHPTPVLLPGKSHGWRSLVGCSPWGCYELDTTERLHFHFSLSHIGEGNGNPLRCSCLESPRHGEAWWAAVYGVSQSWTQLKWLSSSSSSVLYNKVFGERHYFYPHYTDEVIKEQKKISNWPQIRQLLSGKLEIQTQVAWCWYLSV